MSDKTQEGSRKFKKVHEASQRFKKVKKCTKRDKMVQFKCNLVTDIVINYFINI